MDSPTTGGWSRHDKIVIIHATFGGVATLLLVPMGILMRRYVYPKGQWFAVHAAIMGLAFAFIIVTFALGVNLIGSEFTGSEEEITHHKLGLSAIIVMGLQAIGGIIAHFTRRKEEPDVSRHPTRWVHKVLGVLTLGLLYVTVYEGFDDWEMASDAETSVPLTVKIVFWVLLGLFVAAYLAGLAIGMKRKKSLRQNGPTEKMHGNSPTGTNEALIE